MSSSGYPSRQVFAPLNFPRMSRYQLERKLLPYLFISPFFILFATFSVYPLIQALFYSTMKWSGTGPMTFVGVQNYLNLFKDPIFLKSAGNTVYYATGAIFLVLPGSFVLALVLNSALVRVKSIFRIGLILPNLTSTVAATIMFVLILDKNYGLVNEILKAAGLEPAAWLDSGLVKISVLMIAAWRFTGINMLYFLAGLQTIPKEVYEAAAVDGASGWVSLRYITLPLLRPVAMFTIILATIGSFQLFAEPMLLASGGPNNASLTIANYLYRSGFQFARMGYASAIGYVLAAVIFILSLIQIRFLGNQRTGR